ncbi:molybdopterin oxidoreductase, partial [Rhizobiaceae sp. 2RAB30]
MPRFQLSRRGFISSATVAASGLLLAGCDALDGLGEPESKVRGVLEGANDLTYRVQRLLGGRHTLAQEFSEADIRQPQRPNGVT